MQSFTSNIRDHFIGAAVKRLSDVDANPKRSNQHEVGINTAMRRFLGEDKNRFSMRMLHVNAEGDVLLEDGEGTYYDTRAGNPSRGPEWRLYYPVNSVTKRMRSGDDLILGMHQDGRLFFLALDPVSGLWGHFMALFGFPVELPFRHFQVSTSIEEGSLKMGYIERLLLDELGLAKWASDFDVLAADIVAEERGFPKTRRMAELARQICEAADPVADPDAALLDWLDAEEQLFRAIERVVAGPEIMRGFEKNGLVDIDRFVARSLSILNRRKSRRGHSLEHHLASLFAANGLSFTAQGTTENLSRPDFIFPSIESYHDPSFPTDRLFMVASKSTCKDRWRQILAEADRIAEKYLVTLDINLSEGQLAEMKRKGVVVIRPIKMDQKRSNTTRSIHWLISELTKARVRGGQEI